MLKSFIRKCLLSKTGWMYMLSMGMAIGAILLALFVSSVTVPVSHIVHIVLERMLGWAGSARIEGNADMIIWDIRLPRVLLAFTVGSALALSGAAFQGLLRNPLADPFTIGVSSGAALGAVSVIFFQITIFAGLTLPLFGISGGFLALLLVFSMTRLSKRSFSVETIILAGIIVNAFLGAFLSLIIALSGEELRHILYWLMGSVGSRGWSHLQLLLPFFMAGSLLILFQHRELNALALGEDAAQHLGVDVRKRRLFILIGASLLTGASVSVSGTIGFVGLVIPHVVRLIMGPNHRQLLPLSMIGGGTFLVCADLVARTIVAPQELPIGVITALIGTPLFALLLIRQQVGKMGKGFGR